MSNQYSVNNDDDPTDDSKSKNILDMVHEDDSYVDSTLKRKAQVKVSSASSELSSHSLSKSHEVVRGVSWESFVKLVVVLDLLLFFIYISFFVVYLFARFKYNRKNDDDRKPILQIGYVVLRVFFGFSEYF